MKLRDEMIFIGTVAACTASLVIFIYSSFASKEYTESISERLKRIEEVVVDIQIQVASLPKK